MASVLVEPVAYVAKTKSVDVGDLLGVVIAHEIGHLLLGTSVHAAGGLMRAAWTQEMLRHDRQLDWAFTPPDARAIRDAVRVRAAQRLALARIGE